MIYQEITINGQQIKLIPLGDCACGCGGKTNLAKRNHKKNKWVKGQPTRYILGHNDNNPPHFKGIYNPKWKGGKSLHSGGYVVVLMPEHPKTNSSGYLLEHIAIAETILGTPLPVGTKVHHKNGDRTDNRPSNLVICPNQAYHSLLHLQMRAIAACGHKDWRKCQFCKTYDDPQNMYVNNKQAFHRMCHNKYEHHRKLKKL